MSGGFEVAVGFVAHTADRVGEATTLARQMQRREGELGGRLAAVGSPAAQQAVQEFLDRWGYGAGLLAADAGEMADALRACAETYVAVERGVAEEMGHLAGLLADGVDAVRDAASVGYGIGEVLG